MKVTADSRDPITPVRRVEGRILVLQSRYYEAIAAALLAGATAAIDAAGASCDVIEVAGALEIPQAFAQAAGCGLFGQAPGSAAGQPPGDQPRARYCGAVALGCVIRGETAHYDIVCHNANHWLMETAVRQMIPLGNAILTVDNEAQALARANGAGAGKGAEAARACLGLVALQRAFMAGRS